MNDDSNDRIVADLVDEFLRRERAGESLTLEDFVREHGREAAELEDLVPMMRALLDLERSGEAADAPFATTTSSGRVEIARLSSHRRIGDYHILGEIGRGGMGVVYEAWQDSVDRPVALKVLPSAVALDDRSHARFMREARIAAKLEHENVVRIYGMGIEEHTPYYAMEMVEGETLAEILTRLRQAEQESDAPAEPACALLLAGCRGSPGDPLTHEAPKVRWCLELAETFAAVADGLDHAHRKGVIHRDIKPSNLILDTQDRLRILDFGLAHLEGQESLTMSGDLVGTPQYMSPEQAMAKRIPIDHRTDIYSLGATMYEMLTLCPPFRERDHQDTLSQIIEREPTRPSSVSPCVPKDLETIVLKCLRKEPENRYGTSEALAQDLRRFVRGGPVEARPQPTWERIAARVRRQRTKLVVAAVIMVLAVVVGWLAYKSDQAEERIEAATEEARHAKYEAQQAAYESAVREVLKKIYAGQYGLQAVEGELEGHFFNLSGRSLARMTPQEIEALWRAQGTHPVEDAARELSVILQTVPRSDGHYHLAKAYLLLGRDDEAKTELRKALVHDADFVPAMVLQSELSVVDGRTSDLAEIRSRYGRAADWRGVWLEAQESAGKKDWRRAIEAYDKLIALRELGSEPYLGSAVEAHVGRGIAFLELRDYFRSKLDFTAACTLAPGFTLGALLLGKAHYLDGETKAAEALFSEVYDEASAEEKNEAALWIAGIYYSVKDYWRGLYWAEQLGADIPMKERLRGYFLLRAGEADGAIEAGWKAIQKNEEDPIAHWVLASALSNDLGRRRGLDRLRALFVLLGVSERAALLNPGNRFAQRLLVRARADADFQNASLLTRASDFLRRRAMRHPRTCGLVCAALVALLEAGAWLPDLQAQEDFVRGDANSDGEVTISDAQALLLYFFEGFALPDCLDAQDANADGTRHLSDALLILGYLFEDGLPPTEPFPEPDPEPSVLGCNEYGMGDPLDDPVARLVVLSAEVESGRVTIVLGASHSAPIAGHSFSLRLPVEILADAAPIGSDPSGVATHGPFDEGSWDGRTYTHGFLASVSLPFSVTIPEADEVVPIYQLEVCLQEGTTPAGEYPVELVAGELVDPLAGRAIKPTLVNGVLVLDDEVLGCPRPQPPEDCMSDGAICPEIEWVQPLGDAAAKRRLGVSYLVLRSVRETTDGGYIVAGSAGAIPSSVGVYLAKTDRSGNLIWERTFGESGGGNCVQQTADGGYVLAVENGRLDHGWHFSLSLIKTDPEGNVVWKRTFDGPSQHAQGGYVQETTDGGYVIAGSANGEAYLVKTDPEGNLVWERTVGQEGNTNASSIQQTTDGGFIIAGGIPTGGARAHTRDIYLAKTDGTGNLTWERRLGGASWDGFGFAQETTDGGYVVAGIVDYTERNDVYLAKTDLSGDLLWETTFGGPKHDGADTIRVTTQVTIDGGFIIGGVTHSFDGGSYVIRTDNEGQAVWQAIFPYPCRDIRQTTDGGYVFLGDHLVKLAPEPPSDNPFRRGDPNADGTIDITDGIGVLQYLFADAEAPACKDAADTDDSGSIQLTDAVLLFDFLFAGRGAPADPGPTLCGDDPTPDELTCYHGAACQ